jgi:hypothetical protein
MAPPVITQQPTSVRIPVNTSTTLSVVSSGSYQWERKVGNSFVIIIGAISSTYTVNYSSQIPGVPTYYRVKVSNIDGTTISDEASVTYMYAASFPITINPYLSAKSVLIYTRETVAALKAGNPQPADPFVSWAPGGLPAGSLLRPLGRSVSVLGANGLHVQRWVQVQYIMGDATEGVSGAAGDYNCGWICTWDTSGIPPA